MSLTIIPKDSRISGPLFFRYIMYILNSNNSFSNAIILHRKDAGYGIVGTNLLQTQTDSLGTLNRIYLLALAYSLFYNVTKIIEALKKKKKKRKSFQFNPQAYLWKHLSI